MSETFYFSQHFAPIMPIDDNDTPEKQLKRFGYVLKSMRETRLEQFRNLISYSDEAEKDKFTQAWLARQLDSSRGNSLISEWENGSGVPTPYQMDIIIKSLNLDQYDGNYLRNLAFGGANPPEITSQQLNYLKEIFTLEYSEYKNLAYMLDSYMNIIIANEAFYSYLNKLNPTRQYEMLNLHIIELILDPFTGIHMQLGEEQWSKLVPSLIWQLRYTATDIRHTLRYMKLLNRLSNLKIKFKDYWNSDYTEFANSTHGQVHILQVNLDDEEFYLKGKDLVTIGNFGSYRIVYYEHKEKAEEAILKNIIFMSYKHNNKYGVGEEEFSQDCIRFIKSGLRDDDIIVWSDMDIEPSSQWHEVIQEKINSSTIFIALVNHEYMTDSPYINEHELAPAIRRRKENGMPIMPIILSPCEWDKHKIFKHTQSLPRQQTLGHYHDDNKKNFTPQLREQLIEIIREIRLCVQRTTNKNA